MLLLDKYRFRKLDILVLVLVVLAGLLHLSYPLEGDQALFITGASKMSRGALLYRDFWDLKQPGIFGFYLLGGALFGFTEVGIHKLELLYMAAFAVVLWVTLKDHFDSLAIASLVPLLTIGVYYAVTGSWHLTQVEGLVGFPMFLSLWFATEPSSPKGSGAMRLFISGFMGGVVLLFKFLFLPILISFWLTALIDAIVRRRERISKAIIRIGMPTLAGMLLPLAIVLVYFAWFGTLGLLKYTYFEYPSRAMAELPGRRIGSLASSMLWFLGSFTPLTALAFVWAYATLSKRRGLLAAPLIFINLVLWLILGLCVIVVQRLSWWDYHYMLLLVPLGILAAKGLDILWAQTKEAKPTLSSGKGLVGVVLSVGLLFSPFVASLTRKGLYLAYFGLAYGRERRLSYQSEISSSYKTILSEVEFLSKPESLPGDVFIVGNPVYYYLSGRDQAVASNGWMPELYLSEQWNQLIDELSEASPPYIFIASEYVDLVPARSPRTIHFIEENYRVLRSSNAGVWYVSEKRLVGNTTPQDEQTAKSRR
jgi:hypothetical protein